MKISSKIYTGYGVMFLLFIAMSLLVMQTAGTLNPVVEDINDDVNQLNTAITFNELITSIIPLRARLRLLSTKYYFTRNAYYQAQYDWVELQLQDALKQIVRVAQDRDVAKIFNHLKDSIERLSAIEHQFMALTQDERDKALNLFANSMEYQHLDKSIENFIDTYSYRTKMQSDDVFSRLTAISDSLQLSKTVLNRHANMTLLLLALVGSICLLVGVIVSRSISKPLRALKQATELLARGDMSTQTHISSNDEIGVLAASFNTMVSQLQESTVSKTYVDNILSSMNDTLLVVDANARIRTVNPALLELLGYEKAELTGQNLSVILAPGDELLLPSFYLQGQGKSPLSDKIRNTEVRYKTKSGMHLPMLLSGAVMRNREQEIEGIVYVAHDLSELKASQAQLLQSAKLASIGQISSGLAHELNQPLGVIRLRTDLAQRMLKRDLNKVKIGENLNIIDGEVNRATKIIKHLKVFSRQEKNDGHECVDINWLIEESLVLLNESLRLAGIEIKKEFADNLPQVKCDFIQIGEILTNLLTNAVDALKHIDEKQLLVRSYHKDSNICVDVTDTGCGIPQAIIDKVFDPFFTTKQVGEGTGLGMSISYGIAQEHNGALSVKSTEGIGTTFTLMLPAVE